MWERSFAPPMDVAPPASSPPTARPIRSAGAPCGARWEASNADAVGHPAASAVNELRRRASRRHVPRWWHAPAGVPVERSRRDCPWTRRRRPIRCARHRRRYAAHDPDARAGRVVQRRHHRRADSLRGRQTAKWTCRLPPPDPAPEAASSRRLPRPPRRSRNGCARRPSTSSTARRISSARAARCAAPSRAIGCNRSFSGALPAPERRRSRASLPE